MDNYKEGWSESLIGEVCVMVQECPVWVRGINEALMS